MSREFDHANSVVPAGLSVIEANAGTGKTYVISRLVPRLLLEEVVDDLSQVAVVTFTNDAARELTNRIREVLRKLAGPEMENEAADDPGLHALRTKFCATRHRQIVHQALLDMDRLNVCTIHSFCQKIIQNEGLLCGVAGQMELIPDADDVVEEILYDVWRERMAADDFLARLAEASSWSMAEDAKRVVEILRMEGLDFEPAKEEFEPALARLKAMKPDEQETARLSIFINLVESWTLDGGTDRWRQELCDRLKQGDMEATRWVASLGDRKKSPVRKNSELGRRQAAEGASLPIVQRSAEACELSALLRWYWQLDCAAIVGQRVEIALKRNRQITYDGLIRVVRDALRNKHTSGQLIARLRQRFRVALIDESQDTDEQQFEIFDKVFQPGNHRLVMIGDPKQAIYVFRGADVDTYLAARRKAQDRVFTLSRTFRSPQPLVDAVNALFARPDAFLKEGLHYQPAVSGITGDTRLAGHARMNWWVVDAEQEPHFKSSADRTRRIAAMTASCIARLLHDRAQIQSETQPNRAVEPGDFAILVNRHNEAAVMMAELLARNVPAVRAKADDVLKTDEAQEMLTILQAVLQPRRRALVHAAMVTRLLGYTCADLRRMEDEPDNSEMERFMRWAETWERQGVAVLLEQVGGDALLRLAAMEDGERRITNWRHLADLLQDEEHRIGNRPAQLVKWLEQERALPDSEAEHRLLRLDRDARAVHIVTMHAAKGLEFNLVFCPFLWSARKLDRKDVVYRVAGNPPVLVHAKLATTWEDRERQICRGLLEDRLRLAYVSVTRARVACWVLAGAVTEDKYPASALDWLLSDAGTEDFDAWIAGLSAESRLERHVRGLQRICRHSDSAMTAPHPVEDLKWIEDKLQATKELHARKAPSIPVPWEMTSFSALTREKSPYDGGEVLLETPPEPDANSFAQAAGGKAVGSAVHDWLETWDFSAVSDDVLQGFFQRYMIAGDAGAFARMAGPMLRELGGVMLPGLDANVKEACGQTVASEWHFQLPILDRLSVQRLSEVYRAHGEREYAQALQMLPESELAGYLHGFMDRLAVTDRGWGVIDWKTNRLVDYSQKTMRECAMANHYLLQTHLYLVALRRWLGEGTPVVGAWLIFLRGIRERTARGVWHVQPAEELITALDGLFFKI